METVILSEGFHLRCSCAFIDKSEQILVFCLVSLLLIWASFFLVAFQLKEFYRNMAFNIGLHQLAIL